MEFVAMMGKNSSILALSRALKVRRFGVFLWTAKATSGFLVKVMEFIATMEILSNNFTRNRGSVQMLFNVYLKIKRVFTGWEAGVDFSVWQTTKL